MPDTWGPIFAGYFLSISAASIFFSVKRNQKLLQSFYFELLMNFINQVDKFQTESEREKRGDEKVRACSQLCKPRLYGFPLPLT